MEASSPTQVRFTHPTSLHGTETGFQLSVFSFQIVVSGRVPEKQHIPPTTHPPGVTVRGKD